MKDIKQLLVGLAYMAAGFSVLGGIVWLVIMHPFWTLVPAFILFFLVQAYEIGGDVL